MKTTIYIFIQKSHELQLNKIIPLKIIEQKIKIRFLDYNQSASL